MIPTDPRLPTFPTFPNTNAINMNPFDTLQQSTLQQPVAHHPSLAATPVQQQHVLAERFALVFGGNQRVIKCQEKIAEITGQLTDRLMRYHADQITTTALQKECNDIRGQVHSLQMTLSEKLVAQRNKALESEHSLRHIKDMLTRSQELTKELVFAKTELASVTTNLGTWPQTRIPLTPVHPPVTEQSFSIDQFLSSVDKSDSSAAERDTEVIVKRERVTDGEDDTKHNSSCKRYKATPRREPCPHYNSTRGCRFNANVCRRDHRCMNCGYHSHPKHMCDIEICDRRR